MSAYCDHLLVIATTLSCTSIRLAAYGPNEYNYSVFLTSLWPHNVMREEYYCGISCLLYGGYYGYSLVFLSCIPELGPAWEETLKGHKGLNSANFTLVLLSVCLCLCLGEEVRCCYMRMFNLCVCIWL